MISLESLINPASVPAESAEQFIPIDTAYPIAAAIDTALCLGAGGSSGSLADKSIVRNAQGQLIIPGSHLKGRLRHECEKIARSLGWWVAESPDAQQLCAPLPQEFSNSSQYQVAGYSGDHCFISQIFGNPILPSRIIVNDLICSYSPDTLPETIRPGVSINRARQTAEDQKLFFRETSPAHVQLPFTGNLILLKDCPIAALPLLLTAFAHIPALGGSKSSGLGWLTWTQLPIAPTDFDYSTLQAPSLPQPNETP
jgi:CRISPR/Cas system CSM-associated protein Csm3 (group 7 of RAMP superfamily)